MWYIIFWIFGLISAAAGSYMSDTLSVHGLSSDCEPTYMCPTFCLKMQNGCYTCECGESISSYMSSAAEKMKSDYQPIFQTGSKYTSGLMNSGKMGMGLSSSPFNANGISSGNPWMGGGGDAGSSKWFGTSSGSVNTNQGNIGVFNQAQYAPMMTNFLQPDFQEFYRPLTNTMPGYCPPVDHKCPTQCWKTDSFSGCMRCSCTGQTPTSSSNGPLSTTELWTTTQTPPQSTPTVTSSSTSTISPTTPKSKELSGATAQHKSTTESLTTGSSSSTKSTSTPSATTQPKSTKLSSTTVPHTSTADGSSSSTTSGRETSTRLTTTVAPVYLSDSTSSLSSNAMSTTVSSSNRGNEVIVDSTTKSETTANSVTDQRGTKQTHLTSASPEGTTIAAKSSFVVIGNDRQMVNSGNTNNDTAIEGDVGGNGNGQQTENGLSVLQSEISDNEEWADTAKHQTVISSQTPMNMLEPKQTISPTTATTHGVYSQNDILSLLGLLDKNQAADMHLTENEAATVVQDALTTSIVVTDSSNKNVLLGTKGNDDCPAFKSDCKSDCIVNDLLSGCTLCICDSAVGVTTGPTVTALTDACSPLPEVCKDDCIDMDENFCPICTCDQSDRKAYNPSIFLEDNVCPSLVGVCPQQCVTIGEDFCPVCSCSEIIDKTTGIPTDMDTPTNRPVTDTATHDDVMSGARICPPLNTGCPHECLTFDQETFCPVCDCSNKK